MTAVTIEPGDDLDLALQCRLRATGASAAYSAADALSAELWPPTPPLYPYTPPITAPTAAGLPVGWLTTDPATGAAQTGYDQGQVYASLVAATVSTLAAAAPPGPLATYELKIFRQISGNTGRRERIASVAIRVRPDTAG